MTHRRPPLEGVELLLIDGNNLLFRTTGGVESGALIGMLAKLQASPAASVATIMVLDGHAAPGAPQRQRVSARLEVRHAGSQKADDALVQLVNARPPAERSRVLLVTDDRALTERARTAGGRTQRLDWLQGLLDRSRPAGMRGTGIGGGSGPAQSARVREQEMDQDRPPWKPGRGATRKVGNPKRGRR